jgi:hypothetical protein
MALNQKTEIDEITVTDNGTVMVRTKTSIIDGETVIQTSLHRKPIYPGNNYSGEKKWFRMFVRLHTRLM